MPPVTVEETVQATAGDGQYAPTGFDASTADPTLTLGRWIEPEIVDYRCFYAEHPETVVSDDIWGVLEHEIRGRAGRLERDAQAREDVMADIRLRVIEAATGSRQTDADGAPVFDYLEQKPCYIVQHAAIRTNSGLRRERRHGRQTVRLDSLAPHDGEGGADEDARVDPADPMPIDPVVDISAEELAVAIDAHLTPTQHKVLSLLQEGWTRAQIASGLGIDRRTAYDHVQAVRRATVRVLQTRGDDALLADVAQRSTYRRQMPFVAAA